MGSLRLRTRLKNFVNFQGTARAASLPESVLKILKKNGEGFKVCLIASISKKCGGRKFIGSASGIESLTYADLF
jgi:hypothetical protein